MKWTGRRRVAATDVFAGRVVEDAIALAMENLAQKALEPIDGARVPERIHREHVPWTSWFAGNVVGSVPP